MLPKISAHTARKRRTKVGVQQAAYWFIAIADSEHPKFIEFVHWCRSNWHGSEEKESWGFDMSRDIAYDILEDFDVLNDDFTLRLWTQDKGDAALFKLAFGDHF
jgi:hypothetical protein